MCSTRIAIDVGNSRMKWGKFHEGQLVDSVSLSLIDTAEWLRQVDKWFRAQLPVSDLLHDPDRNVELPAWSVASVNRAASDRFAAWLDRERLGPIVLLDHPNKLPLAIDLAEPQAVGIDRLLNAVAANAIRPAGQPAIVVDCGSAITVDAVSREGAFIGGAIAVGIGLAARALDEFTFALPYETVSQAARPIGRNTSEAIRSGLFWGAVGTINQLVQQILAELPEAAVYITGGDASLVAPELVPAPRLVPELTLHGIYLATKHVEAER